MSPSRDKARQIADISLIAIFLVVLALPLVGSLFNLDRASVRENSQAASFPELRLKRRLLVTFPTRFEAYFNDSFGFRRTLIRWLSWARLSWFGASTSPQVLVGRHGWLYYTPEAVGRDYRTTAPFTPQQLDAWQRTLEARRDWLAERGIRYLFVIAPDKQSVYPEYLPKRLQQRSRQPSRLDQLVAHLRRHSEVDVLDLRDALSQARASRRIYYSSDSHWNHEGAFWAYHQMANVLHSWFPEVRALPRSAFDNQSVEFADGDLARMLGLTGQVREPCPILLPRGPRLARRSELPVLVAKAHCLGHLEPVAYERPDAYLPRAMLFGDSFALDLLPLLAEHFQRLAYVPADVLDPAVVEKERPHVVIQEMVERKLGENAPADPPWPRLPRNQAALRR